MSIHIVNVSGGKDSAACYMLAVMRRKPFRAVFADTGHENELTYDWIGKLTARTGGPKVEVVKADFADRIAQKRALVQDKWVREGVADEIVRAALDVLHPTGVPFLDLCLWKGRFPSARARFCTEELKAVPIFEQIFAPALKKGPVVSWQGERRDESPRRAKLPRHHRIRYEGLASLHIWRPILMWSAEHIFALHRKYGLQPNPLYRMGMSRVGCFPCIHAQKGELAGIFKRFPEQLKKLRFFENLISKASRRGQSTFFPASTTPQGRRLVEAQKQGLRLDEPLPGIDEILEWSRTSHGGRQFDGLRLMEDEHVHCSSQYGLCE